MAKQTMLRRLLGCFGLAGCVAVQIFLLLAIALFIPFDEVTEGPKLGQKVVCGVIALLLVGPELWLIRQITTRR